MQRKRRKKKLDDVATIYKNKCITLHRTHVYFCKSFRIRLSKCRKWQAQEVSNNLHLEKKKPKGNNLSCRKETSQRRVSNDANKLFASWTSYLMVDVVTTLMNNMSFRFAYARHWNQVVICSQHKKCHADTLNECVCHLRLCDIAPTIIVQNENDFWIHWTAKRSRKAIFFELKYLHNI